MPIDDVAMMTFAMANGVALEKMLEPDVVDDELYGLMMMVFFTGLRTLVEESSAARSSRSRSPGWPGGGR